MKSQNTFTFLFLTFVILWLSSCFSPAKLVGTTTAITGNMVANRLSPPEGKALVYIVRRPAYFASIMEFGVDMDRQYIGSTQAKRFLYVFADPGEHSFVGHAENKSQLTLTVEAGATYYIEQKARIGWLVARNKLELMDENKGRLKLQKCKLSRDNITMAGF